MRIGRRNNEIFYLLISNDRSGLLINLLCLCEKLYGGKNENHCLFYYYVTNNYWYYVI